MEKASQPTLEAHDWDYAQAYLARLFRELVRDAPDEQSKMQCAWFLTGVQAVRAVAAQHASDERAS